MNRIGLLLIDVQEKLFPAVTRADTVLERIQFLIRSFRAFNFPMVVTEQYPQGLGPTLESVRKLFLEDQEYYPKTSFSAVGDDSIKQAIENSDVDQWLIAGVETHVCVLQTAKDLLNLGLKVIVTNDSTSSRYAEDYSSAISELRGEGVRVSCTETILFELLKSSRAPQFKEISKYIKQRTSL